MTNSHTSQAQWPSANGERPVRLLFFGAAVDKLGRSADLALPPGGCTVAALRDLIARRFDAGASALAEPNVRIAVNQQAADEHAWVCSGDEVSIAIPPPGA